MAHLIVAGLKRVIDRYPVVENKAVALPGRLLLRHILEKPTPDELAGLEGRVLRSPNAWAFTPRIFEACDAIGPSERGELELPTAVQHAIDHLDCRVRVLATGEPILDLSARSDVAAVEQLLSRAVRP